MEDRAGGWTAVIVMLLVTLACFGAYKSGMFDNCERAVQCQEK